MDEETPVLRADALDDDLDLEDEVLPRFATGGVVQEAPIASDYRDEVPLPLRHGCEHFFEPYENGQGGWSFRRIVVP